LTVTSGVKGGSGLSLSRSCVIAQPAGKTPHVGSVVADMTGRGRFPPHDTGRDHREGQQDESLDRDFENKRPPSGGAVEQRLKKSCDRHHDRFSALWAVSISLANRRSSSGEMFASGSHIYAATARSMQPSKNVFKTRRMAHCPALWREFVLL
jgi:hypothetical protein